MLWLLVGGLGDVIIGYLRWLVGLNLWLHDVNRLNVSDRNHVALLLCFWLVDWGRLDVKRSLSGVNGLGDWHLLVDNRRLLLLNGNILRFRRHKCLRLLEGHRLRFLCLLVVDLLVRLSCVIIEALHGSNSGLVWCE